MNNGEFRQAITRVLAARAASRCSNPDCLALTSGPSSEVAEAINVGEAAHIYGGKPGSARYDEAMTDQERSDATNGIWLCRICHKKIDADPAAFPAGLLFEWKREHEVSVSSQLGKASDLRMKVQERMLLKFPEAGYLAQQTIIEKPRFWEYKLTAQLLRDLLEPLEAKARHLTSGYYALLLRTVSIDECIDWMGSVMDDIVKQVGAIDKLVNVGFKQAWGPPGFPGSEREIYNVCCLLRDVCARCLSIEERVRFVRMPSGFDDVSSALSGVMPPVLEKIFSISPWVSSIFSEENPSGNYTLNLEFGTPDGFVDRLNAAVERGVEEVRKSR